MLKTSTETLALSGRTMGTEWSVQIPGQAPPGLRCALQAAVDRVDRQMSTWTSESDLMRFNAGPLNEWIALPAELMAVLTEGLALSRATAGAFEMNIGAAVRAWGFTTQPIGFEAIEAARHAPKIAATEALELDLGNRMARKSAALSLDLSGIAKGYGVDSLAEVIRSFGIKHALCAIDGELRALGAQSDGTPWSVAIEMPDSALRQTHSRLALHDMAVATSGDYRHYVMIRDQRLSHTIDPRRNAPLMQAPASVSVLAPSCMQADAMATALMVMGAEAGLAFAKTMRLNALFLTRTADGLVASGSGVFAG